MSFADELRNTTPVKPETEKDVWKNFCISAGMALVKRIPDSCREAARKGERKARISDQYFADPRIPFPYSEVGLLGFFEDPYIKIMKKVISSIVLKKCNKLGLRFLGVRYRRVTNGYLNSYVISIEVGW